MRGDGAVNPVTLLLFLEKHAPSGFPGLSWMKSLSATITWSAANTLAKALILLEVKEEKSTQEGEIPQKRTNSVPVVYEQ